MIYARQPTQADRLELQRMTRQAVGRVSQRAQMILLSIQQRTVPALAPLFPRSRASVRCWSRRFNAQGPAGLYDDPRRGRPRQVSPQVVETIVTRLQDDPRHAGSLATYGTVVMVGAALVHQLGGRLRTSTWRNALQRRGLRWGRPRLAMALTTDPAKAYTQWVMAKAVSDAGPQVTLRSGEESRVPLLPLMRAMWHWVGQPLRIPPPGTKVTRARCGAWDIRTGRWVYLLRERLRTDDFLACLEHLLVGYPDGPVLLLVDNFSSHTAPAVNTWRATHARLHLHYLPKDGSHVNPGERLWLQLKNPLAANRL